MTGDFDLNSRKWLALIFEGKNKEYGAYVHRNESSDRHLKALIVVTIASLLILYLPKFIKAVIPEEKQITQETELVMAVLDVQEQELPEDNVVRQIDMPPPPEIKASIQFTVPKIVEDDKIRDDQLMLTQQELTESKAEISIATVEGSLDTGVNIADLVEHKVVFEEPEKTQIFTHTEEPASFPGGDAEMMKWLKANIDFPPSAAERGIEGIVHLRFVVKPDGSIDEVEVMKGLDPSCDREARTKVAKMPRWTPGKNNGHPVHVYYSLPVRFKLDQR